MNDAPLKLPRHLAYLERHFRVAGDDWTVDPLLLAAVCDRESGGGVYLVPPDPSGVGDRGHGRGLMQIDDRTWVKWLRDHRWQDALTNIRFGAEILRGEMDRFAQTGHGIECAVAAYNCGPARVRQALAEKRGCDFYTHGQDYAADVLRRRAAFAALQQGGK
jgi:soluble lytic murein transglycosylase-like protein